MSKEAITIDDIKPKFKAWLESAKQIFTLDKVKFTEAKLEDGTVIYYDADALVPNTPVFVLDPAGNQIPLIDGDYNIPDLNISIQVMGGIVTEVGVIESPATQEPVMQPAPVQGAPNPTQSMADPKTQPKAVVESIVKETRFHKDGKFSDELFDAEIKKVASELLAAELKKFTDYIASNDAVIVELKKQNEALKTELTSKNEAFAKDLTAQVDLNKNLFNIVSKIADLPADTKVTEDKKIVKVEKDFNKINEEIKKFHAQVFKQ